MNKTKLFAVAMAASIVFLCTPCAVFAVTENLMWSIATTVRDKDFSTDVNNAPILGIKACHLTSEDARFTLELNGNAKWAYKKSSGAQFDAMFIETKNGFESRENIMLTNQPGLTYTFLQISDNTAQVFINGSLEPDYYIGIPMIVEIDGIAQSSVSVMYGDSFGISSGGPYIFANAGNANEIFINISSNAELEDGAITGSIKIECSAIADTKEIRLDLPFGFYFDKNADVSVRGDGGFSFVKMDKTVFSGADRIMRISLEGVRKSLEKGTLVIDNIVVLPEKNASSGPIAVTINGAGITSEKFTFADVSFDEIPEPEQAIPEEQQIQNSAEEPETVAPAVEKPIITITADSNIISINGEPLELNTPAFIDNAGRMLAPVRFVSELYNVGGNIEWDAKNKTVTIVSEQADNSETITRTVVFTIGSKTYTIGNEDFTMDTAPLIKDSHTFVPVRFLAEALGASVTYVPDTKTAEIHPR